MPRFDPHPERRPAVVTGASSGIGAASAVALARSGYPVVLGARRLDVCNEVVDAIRAEGGEAAAFLLDLSDPGSVDIFAEKAAGAFGPVEILVSNAARIIPGTALETTPEAFEDVLHVNLGAAHRLVRAFGPGMVARRRGDMLFVTSDVVAHPRPRMAAYVASKWGLEGFVTALQMELEGSGVRAMVVRPGPTMTGMGMDWDPTVTGEVLAEWVRWGLARHSSFLQPDGVALAIAHAVSAPRGTHLSVIEVQPEARLDDEHVPDDGARAQVSEKGQGGEKAEYGEKGAT